LPQRSNEYLVDTDVLIEHLTLPSHNKDSCLELLMQNGICFSTVLNASELLFNANSFLEEKIIINLLSSLKILGLHSRYSLLIPKYRNKVKNMNDALMCIVADYNKLPIITLNKKKYSKSNLAVYHPLELDLRKSIR